MLTLNTGFAQEYPTIAVQSCPWVTQKALAVFWMGSKEILRGDLVHLLRAVFHNAL